MYDKSISAEDLFHPEYATKDDMIQLADNINEYLDVLEEVMVIPEELIKDEELIKAALKRSRKLVRKLRNGDKSVFKDLDDET